MTNNFNDNFNNILFISIMICSVIAYAIVILRNIGIKKNKESYFLCNRNLGVFALTLTIIATQVGGGMIIGISDEGYKLGFTALAYPLGQLLGLVVIALFLAKYLKRNNISTMVEIFKTKYKSSKLQKISSIISAASLYFIIIAQGVATKKLLTSLGYGESIFFVGLWSILIFYTALGGLKTVIETDILQIIFVGIGLVLVGLTAYKSTNNIEIMTVLGSANEIPIIKVVNWMLWPCCYMWIEQDMVQRFFAAKSSKTLKISSLLAAVGILSFALIPVLIGIFANYLGMPIPKGTSVLMVFAQNYLTPSLYTIMILTIILAILSTADSLLCAVSCHVNCDFSLKNIPKNKFGISTENLTTILIGISSFFMIYLSESVLNVLMFSYGLCVSVLFTPLVIGLISKNPSKEAAIVSMICGSISFITFILMKNNAEYLALPLSVLGYAITNLVVNKKVVGK